MRLPRLCLFLLMIALALPLAGQTEKIVSFDSRIVVNPDAGMLVREKIIVQSAGVSMRHGIYREFPTRYKDRAGNAYVVGFEILSVMRDGHAEPYHTEAMNNGVRVYFGASNILLQPGWHAYEFTYRTNRQLGFFKDHDELYWNVTGNGWKFPIDAATATVVLPAQVRSAVTQSNGYTGAQGEQGKDFTTGRDQENNPVFQAGGLEPKQGLTIAVSWPKGYFQEPTGQQKLTWFLQDNGGAFTGSAGLAVVLLYYLLVWVAVGRDPARGAVVPLYEPPDNLSPGAIRYLTNMGFDGKVFTSAIIGLAAKGYLRIEQVDSNIYRLVRKPDVNEAKLKLAPEEKAMANLLFDDGDRLEMVPEHHLRMQRAQQALKHSLHDSLEKTLFVTNVRYLWPGIVLTVATIASAMLMSGGAGAAVGAFMSVWLTGWTVGVAMLLRMVVRAWQAVRLQGGLAIVPAGIVSAFSIPFLGGELFGIVALGASVGAVVVLILFAAIATNILFHYLLKAPTRAGRQVLDRVEGFKTFLSAVEADRYDRVMTVVKTPELFERFYPYAVALDVEHAWAQQFAHAMAAAAAPQGQTSGGTAYLPSWYSGAGSFAPTDFSSSFSGSFSSAVSSASSSPGSSSGSGGGGSSGGGGGGGGGGGW